MKIPLVFGAMLLAASVLSAQIPDSILVSGQRIMDSIHRYHEVPNLLQYNCRLSYIDMVGSRWPACPKNAGDTIPDFTEHHELDLYEQYRLIYDYVNHAQITAFSFLQLDYKGNYVTTNYFLSDHPIKQYQRINYSKAGAIDIARKIGLTEGVEEWKVELRCYDLKDYRAATPLEQLEFIWEIRNVMDPGDGCEISGQFLMISADSGKLLHEDEYHVICQE